MDAADARRRLAAARVGRLGTVTPGGMPHLVPVVFALIDDILYSAVDSKPKTTMALQRLDNIDETGRACLLVDEYSDDWSALWWVRVDGSAEVLNADPDKPGPRVRSQGRPGQVSVALESLTRKYPQYVRQPPDGPVIAISLMRWCWWEANPAE